MLYTMKLKADDETTECNCANTEPHTMLSTVAQMSTIQN